MVQANLEAALYESCFLPNYKTMAAEIKESASILVSLVSYGPLYKVSPDPGNDIGRTIPLYCFWGGAVLYPVRTSDAKAPAAAAENDDHDGHNIIETVIRFAGVPRCHAYRPSSVIDDGYKRIKIWKYI